ncbi:FAD binding domain-containing protein [Granulicella paludicola]|uniref:FAD binding domain-containing protein n=1 Tax=Granulicella paludicola TaxID=474951 RepID=UPI0021DF4A9B|nr:FAD binding domain-containing protein [Granulicella paludicola]
MHSDVTQFDLAAPPSLQAVLKQLAAEPGKHAPIAGGTEMMVALGAGRLQQRSLLSIQHLRELRFIRVEDRLLHIGSGTTFTDIRRSAEIAKHLPLLVQSASWTGSVANQNRGTIGGNICNASPAADTPPALLAYGATVTLVSASGERTMRYVDFHLGYKKTALRPDELLHSIHVPLVFGDHRQYIRKVGTRNAQAISKIALAAVAKVEEQRLADVRLGAASLTDRPVRCSATEAVLSGASLASDALEETIRLARAALAGETHAIDDIRSTARYRGAVAGNLLEEFLRSLAG